MAAVKLGAIDIGSNAIRLLISRVIPTPELDYEFKKVEFIRIPLRLGDDVFTTGRVSKEKQELFMMTMNAFKLILDIHRVKHFKACATSAMREAKNGQVIVGRVERKYNFKVDIISGQYESDLILKSVMSAFPQKGHYMNIDVGGGSTEITIIKDRKVINSQSFPIGSVRVKDGRVAPGVWAAMQQWVEQHVDKSEKPVAIGTGGNINKLYSMVMGDSKKAMTVDVLQGLYEKIVATPITDRIYKMNMNPDRADVVDHAAKIYLAIMKWAGTEKIYSPNAGLKDGLIMELWETHKNIVR